MKQLLLFILCITVFSAALAQPPTTGEAFTIKVYGDKQVPAALATVELLHAADSALIITTLTNDAGSAAFTKLNRGSYVLRISLTGYVTYTGNITLPLAQPLTAINLLPATNVLGNVTVSSAQQPVQFQRGKMVINVGASVTNAGATVMEVLQKTPGVTVDRNGNISLQAKSNVLILIDGRPTYVSGSALESLLSGMSASSVDQIELITNPPAKYDASGNAGIINIKTKKSSQQGFNGNLNLTASIGRYPKLNGNTGLNFRKGKFNAFVNYNANIVKSYTELYAFRTYFKPDGTDASYLDQPTYFLHHITSHTFKTGVDYFLSKKTTLGLSLNSIIVNRKLSNTATASWLNQQRQKDSSINTTSNHTTSLKNISVNINAKHTISETQDISVDLDAVKYNIDTKQVFANQASAQSSQYDSTEGQLPTKLTILSAKADYNAALDKTGKLAAGFKTSRTSTDNIAAYKAYNGTTWIDDFGKSNHFIYDENIYAAYTSFEKKINRLSFQAGLRYEFTHYNANQLGNVQVKDSSFSRNYGGLFPSGYVSYDVDSSNTFTLTAGRRIDRPAFQALNPFVYIINKYTIQRGNPYFLPQYSLNLELSHQYKQLLTTTLSYSVINNYFSQLFLTDPNGILVYSQGNVGKVYNIGLSVAAQVKITGWWSITGEVLGNYKRMKGFVWNNYSSRTTQLNISANNQFTISKKITAELSGFYTTRARNDLQELLYPTGQLSAGASMPILKNKGSLKLSIRDIFHTNVMEGLTSFETAQEYFIEHRDSRVVSLAFTWRFGKQLKQVKRSAGGATEEIQRASGG